MKTRVNSKLEQKKVILLAFVDVIARINMQSQFFFFFCLASEVAKVLSHSENTAPPLGLASRDSPGICMNAFFFF